MYGLSNLTTAVFICLLAYRAEWSAQILVTTGVSASYVSLRQLRLSDDGPDLHFSLIVYFHLLSVHLVLSSASLLKLCQHQSLASDLVLTTSCPTSHGCRNFTQRFGIKMALDPNFSER